MNEILQSRGACVEGLPTELQGASVGESSEADIPTKKLAHGQVSSFFLYYEGALKEGGGGVQICTREYYHALQTAGFHLRPIQVLNDRRILTRVRRRMFPRGYQNAFITRKVLYEIRKELRDPPRFIFLNQAMLRPLGKIVKELFGANCRVVLLSHGLMSVDYLHQLRGRQALSRAKIKHADLLLLARQLLTENHDSQYLDHVFCLAPFEVEIERWLGARRVTYLPRMIMEPPLDWQPVAGRIGYVGRMDHPPNREGLFLFLNALAKIIPAGVRLRLVGSPRHEGEAIAGEYGFVEYLGPLTDPELRREAATWNCFVNPIFCYAMGCSTKMGVAIGWEIPVVTTSMGCRGYKWREGTMPIADMPESLATLALQLGDPEHARRAQLEMRKVRSSSPSGDEVMDLIRTALSAD